MEKTVEKTEEELVAGRSLVDLVFSWSIGDVLNKDLCRNKVCMHAILLMFMCMMHFRFLIFYMVCFSGCLVGRKACLSFIFPD
jgi:hypothetical protein